MNQHENTSGSRNLELEGFVLRPEVNLDKFKMAFVGVGQAGGKITAEFIKLGYYGALYNTCQEDLDDAVSRIKHLNNAKYKTVKLEGYDGAAKDREIGLQAVRENQGLLKSELLTDKTLIDADFVWIVVSLGGGTGNGSVSTMAQIVSGVMRKNNRYKVKKDPRTGKVLDIGKATVGVIAAIPEEDAKYKIKLNAAQALNELKKLQEKKLIGSVLIVDNEKLINDFLLKPDEEVAGMDWVQYGNETTAAVLSETSLVTCLPGRETLDSSEVLDILSTPGFLNLGKRKLHKNWLQNLKAKTKEEDQKIIDYMVSETFKKQNIFAEGYDHNQCMSGGLAIISSDNGNVINTKNSIMIKKAMNRVLEGPLVETPHYGIFDNHIFGTSKRPQNNKDEAIVYTLAVIKELPRRVFDMTKEALEEKKKRDAFIKENQVESLDDMLTDNIEEVATTQMEEMDLDDILFGDNPLDDPSDQESNKEPSKDDDPYSELEKMING